MKVFKTFNSEFYNESFINHLKGMQKFIAQICLEMTTIHPKLPNLAGAPGHLGPSRAVKWKRAQAHWNSPPDTQKWKYCNQHPIICTCVISGKNKRQKKKKCLSLLSVKRMFFLEFSWSIFKVILWMSSFFEHLNREESMGNDSKWNKFRVWIFFVTLYFCVFWI